LDVDDGGGFVQLMLESLVLPLQARELVGERIFVRLGAPLLRREPGELAGVALAPPRHEVRRVQALPAQQLADPALLARR